MNVVRHFVIYSNVVKKHNILFAFDGYDEYHPLKKIHGGNSEVEGMINLELLMLLFSILSMPRKVNDACVCIFKKQWM